MKIFKCTAPPYTEADIWYVTEKDWHSIMDSLEAHVDIMEIGETVKFEVELLELTAEQWERLQETFIDNE
jgi:hypothetical protein